MGAITISMKDEDERLLRRLAAEKYGKQKGAISRMISHAMQKEQEELREEEARKKFFEILEKAKTRPIGKRLWKTRDDLYDR